MRHASKTCSAFAASGRPTVLGQGRCAPLLGGKSAFKPSLAAVLFCEDSLKYCIPRHPIGEYQSLEHLRIGLRLRLTIDNAGSDPAWLGREPVNPGPIAALCSPSGCFSAPFAALRGPTPVSHYLSFPTALGGPSSPRPSACTTVLRSLPGPTRPLAAGFAAVCDSSRISHYSRPSAALRGPSRPS